MANSKAIIHPIQLQNAELNLNKYDAEIKQYSGFNKNNAPFVGGCLANVFTKDTQIEGTSEDTYIDTNGDVYHADTEGLWKNGEKINEYPEGTVFYHREEIKTDRNNIVYMFDEKHYIFSEDGLNTKIYNDGTVIEFIDSFNGVISWNTPLSNVVYNIEHKGGFYFYLASFNVNYGGLRGCEIHFRCFDDETGERINIQDSYIQDYYYVNINSSKEPVPPTVLFFNNYAYLFSNAEEKYMGSAQHITGGLTIYMEKGQPTCGRITSHAITLSDSTSFLGSVNNFFVLSSGAFIFAYGKANFSNDKYYAGFITGADENQRIVLTGTLKAVTGDISDSNVTHVSRDKEFIAKRDFFSGVMNFTFSGSSDNNNFFKLNGISRKNTWDRLACFQWDSENKLFVNNAGAKCEAGIFRVLIYNNEIIGISGKTESNITGVLLSDWNDIDANTIILTDDNTIIYKSLSKKKWFKFYIGTPAIKCINGQLVQNASVVKNAYRLSDRTFLNFANDWNCYYAWEPNITSAAYVVLTDRQYWIDYNNYNYIASAVNEYSLGNNSSILLNPVANSVVPEVGYIRHEKTPSILGIVNVYKGQEEIKYYYSLGCTESLDENLIGLPFPITTDGNVQYSPSLFSEIKDSFGNRTFIKSGNTMYPLIIGNNSEPIMAFYLASGIDNLDEGFIVQGQFYGIINNGIYSLQYSNGVVSDISFIVDCTGLQFCGSTPYEALFFSPTNRCLYSFVGANVLNPKQFVDKISQVTMYKYNPATQSIFLVTDIGVIVTSLFGIYQIDMLGVTQIYLLDNGVVLADDNGNYRYLKYYKEDGDGYTKENIRLETCFYGSDNQTVTINDCLYMRLFSEEMESGDVEVSATTISNLGRVTEKTTFKIKKEDWDKETNSIYLRYQPKEQRGLGVSFKIESPFKIASLSVGSQPDAILVDKVSKGAVNAPYNNNSSITEW
jgi:hypothetical protein